MSKRLPTYFISHGGGPWPWIPQMRQMLAELAVALEHMPAELPEVPSAVLMVSAHWEAESFCAMAHPRPPMLYDYYNFPPHTYEVRYPAPGSPMLAGRVQELIRGAGLPSGLDTERGFDHGAFVPMALMYPQADMPMVQLSLHRSLDPALHIALGRALAPLRGEGVLIVGSGVSYHNLRALGPQGRVPSKAFDDWLQSTLSISEPAERLARLVDWAQAPSARFAHPREEHLIPLMVAVGAAEADRANCCYHEEASLGGITTSSFRFDPTPA